MPSVRQIRGRIRSVRNTSRVTRAMQMVAASKMRRAQEQVLASRPYATKLQSVLAGLTNEGVKQGDIEHPLLVNRAVKNVLVLEITPDRGLAGGLPGNINRATALFMFEQGVPASVVTVGRKGRDFMARTGRNLMASFLDMGDRPTLADTLPITRLVQRVFMEGETDAVHLAYTRYVNTLIQEPVVTQLLPVDPGKLTETGASTGYLYEPNPLVVLGALLPRFLEVQVFQAFLESNASEQSARMVAMRNATEAADEMVEGLTLELNKARQNMITAELLDLVGGVAALES